MNGMFPEGVIYEGVSEEPLSFRGCVTRLFDQCRLR